MRVAVWLSLTSTLALANPSTQAAPAAQQAPQKSASKPLSPLPSEAECKPMGAPMRPLPFGPGEELLLGHDSMGMRAGEMKMTTLPVRNGSMAVETTVETNTFFSKIRRVRGLARSELSPSTLRPTRYFEDARENELHRVANVTFNPAARQLTLVNTVNDKTGAATQLRIGNDWSDVGGAVHLLRSIPVKEGQQLCFDVYGIRRVWRVWGTVQPKEHVSLPIGEFDAWHLAGQAAPLTNPNARREVHVWVSDDARRLPLAALGIMEFGAVRASLKGFSRPGEANARAENKANIKW